MAIFHMNIKIISRSKGQSVVAAAAYRSASQLYSEYDGITRDFTHKKWVRLKEIILPENAPLEYSDREVLWNAVEKSEKNTNAQLAREIEVALPIEMSETVQLSILEEFVEKNFTRYGIIADIVIHNPPVMNDKHQPIDVMGNVTSDARKMQFNNPHAHILTCLRPVDENGNWVAKTEKEYLCIRDGVEKGFTALKFKTAEEVGWKKQYLYMDGNVKIWLAKDDGFARHLQRISRNPKASKYRRKNPTITYLNSHERAKEWRQSWENIVNNKFEALGMEVRIDSRSYEDQGRYDEIPSVHQGPAATAMKRRREREIREGKPEDRVVMPERAEINEIIGEFNKEVNYNKEVFGNQRLMNTTLSSIKSSITEANTALKEVSSISRDFSDSNRKRHK